MPYIDSHTKIDDLLVSTNEILSRIENALRAESELPDDSKNIIITYPESGDTKELLTGVTSLDFFGGNARLPTGETVSLSDALREHGHSHCHSIAINAELPVSIRIDDSGLFTTNAGVPFQISNISFQRVSITTTRKTNISVYASTMPKAAYLEPGAFYSENPYTYRGTVAAAGTPIEVDVRATLGRNAHNGWIANMGTTAGVLHVYLYDGISWTTTYYTIGVDGVENMEMADIAAIKIDSDVNATTFEINLR